MRVLELTDENCSGSSKVGMVWYGRVFGFEVSVGEIVGWIQVFCLRVGT